MVLTEQERDPGGSPGLFMIGAPNVLIATPPPGFWNTGDVSALYLEAWQSPGAGTSAVPVDDEYVRSGFTDPSTTVWTGTRKRLKWDDIVDAASPWQSIQIRVETFID